MSQTNGNGTKDAAKPAKHIKVDKIADMIGKDVTLGMKNRTEDTRNGVLQDMGPAGALLKYESRGSIYHEVIPLQNVDSVFIRQPLEQ